MGESRIGDGHGVCRCSDQTLVVLHVACGRFQSNWRSGGEDGFFLDSEFAIDDVIHDTVPKCRYEGFIVTKGDIFR